MAATALPVASHWRSSRRWRGHGGRGAHSLAGCHRGPPNPSRSATEETAEALPMQAMEEVSELVEFMRQAMSLITDDDPSDDAAPSRPTTFLNEAPCHAVSAPSSRPCRTAFNSLTWRQTKFGAYNYKSIDRFLLVHRIIEGDTAEPRDPDRETVASISNVAGQVAHPLPAFGSSSSVEAHGLKTNEVDVRSTNDTDHSLHGYDHTWKQDETQEWCCSLPAATLLLLLSSCRHNQGCCFRERMVVLVL